MAGVSNNPDILNVLKRFYAKEGVQSLFDRNSPTLRAINKMRVEGEEQAFSAMYGFGGAISGDYTVALANVASQAKNVEFKVTPGQVFALYSVNAKEVLASKTNRGAYMRIAGNKHFASCERMRKALASSLFARGYGELAILGSTDAVSTTADTTFELPDYAIMAFDVGSKLALKTSVASPTEAVTMNVTKIVGNKVTVRGDAAYTPAATDVVCIAGAVDTDGTPHFPVGFGGWLPVVGERNGATWDAYINQPFYGVNRSVAPDRLAGKFVKAASGDSKKKTIKSLLKLVRRGGSRADLIVLNDNDWEAFSDEIESTNSYFTQTSTSGKKQASVGFSEITASFSTNFIENIIDDPYCPEGMFYILDKDTVELWTYTNVPYIEDGVNGNEPGKIMNADEDNDKGREDDPFKLLIDDYISIEPGHDKNGVTSIVATNLFATFAIYNQSVNGVGIFDGAENLVATVA